MVALLHILTVCMDEAESWRELFKDTLAEICGGHSYGCSVFCEGSKDLRRFLKCLLWAELLRQFVGCKQYLSCRPPRFTSRVFL